MNKKEYSEYLKTSEWQVISEEVKRIAGNRCQMCNSSKNLEVHHRTYERVGRELLSDLVCLCHECHAKHHGKDNEAMMIALTHWFPLALRDGVDSPESRGLLDFVERFELEDVFKKAQDHFVRCYELVTGAKCAE